MRRKSLLALLFLLLVASPAVAQEWARKMFETTNHNFGPIARGAKAEYDFVLSNIYIEDVHIASVRSSCGCTRASIKKPLLKTYEKGAIVASINTRAFYGTKGATITVTLDKPFYAEVQLHVQSYIRTDVVLHPGSVELGTVDEGTPVEKKLAINYAGRDDWQILEVRSDNPHIAGQVVELSRGGGQISYELVVCADAKLPPGYIHDHLLLITNDHNATQVPVLVEGRVLSGVTVSPASLFMGVVEPGQRVTKKLVVRGNKPFRVVSVTCDGDCFECDCSAERTPKTLHLIPVTFVAGDHPGKATHTIRIETDMGQEATPSLSAYAVISPPKLPESAGGSALH